jgi:CO dehydrogenase/acetyl-CoA synthase alpha subunit
MSRKKKTAREKLEAEHASHGSVSPIPPIWQASMGKGMMVVPRPLDVDAMMRTARKGKLVTLTQIRARLAKKSKVNQCCPLTTGIFARLAAEAAEEDAAAGKGRVTPWWRTVRDNGQLIDKFPGGGKLQAARLRREGHSITPGKGKAPGRVKIANG